jgi:hypothetical protein
LRKRSFCKGDTKIAPERASGHIRAIADIEIAFDVVRVMLTELAREA